MPKYQGPVKPKSQMYVRRMAKKTQPGHMKKQFRHQDNCFALTGGKVEGGFLKFHVKRTTGAPALVFTMGQQFTLTHGSKFYEVTVNTFVPRTLVGSVVSASGEISFFYHDEIAEILSDW
jgi:hypothetical protein